MVPSHDKQLHWEKKFPFISKDKYKPFSVIGKQII